MASSILTRTFAGIRRSSKPTETIGHSGTAVHGGYVMTTETRPDMIGTQRYLTFADILANISIIAAGTRYFLNLVVKAGWKLEPADDSEAALAMAERVEAMIHDMETPWHRVVRRAAMYRFYGFSLQEWTAKKTDEGDIGLLDIAPRPQITIERWDVDETGKVIGMVQRSPQTSEELYLSRGKTVYLVDDSISDSPEGFGLFRHLAEPSQRLKRMQELEGFNYEMDLRGVPVGRAPLKELRDAVLRGDMSEAQFNAAVAPLSTFIDKHIRNPQLGLLLDSMPYRTTDERQTSSPIQHWDLEVLKSDSSQSSIAVAGAIERLNREMARVLGVEHLLLGGDGTGSFALSRDKTDNFALTVDSTLQELAASFNRDVIDVIWILNGWDKKLKPKFKTEAIQYRDIEQITGALKDMASSGALLDPADPAINEVRNIIGLSNQPDLDQLVNSLLTDPEDKE